MIRLPSSDALLTVDELAEQFGLTASSVYKWNGSGTGPKRHRIGKRIYYRLSEVAAWVDSRIVPAKELGRTSDNEEIRFWSSWLTIQQSGARLEDLGPNPTDEQMRALRPDWDRTCDGCRDPIPIEDGYVAWAFEVGRVVCLDVRCFQDPAKVAVALAHCGRTDDR